MYNIFIVCIYILLIVFGEGSSSLGDLLGDFLGRLFQVPAEFVGSRTKLFSGSSELRVSDEALEGRSQCSFIDDQGSLCRYDKSDIGYSLFVPE